MSMRMLSFVFFLFVGCSQAEPELPEIAEVPPFVLLDQHGHQVSRSSLRGHVWIANFIFTSCPDVCPLLTKKMRQLRLGLVRKGVKVRFLSFSVDPERDTPEVLRSYAEARGAQYPDWSFLTGDVDEIKAVVASGFKQTIADDPRRPGNILHGSHFVLVDGTGMIRGFHRSDPAGLRQLSQAAAALARQEASR